MNQRATPIDWLVTIAHSEKTRWWRMRSAHVKIRISVQIAKTIFVAELKDCLSLISCYEFPNILLETRLRVIC